MADAIEIQLIDNLIDMINRLGSFRPEIAGSLGCPASSSEIEMGERAMGRKFPSALSYLFRRANGERGAVVFGEPHRFLSIGDMLEVAKGLRMARELSIGGVDLTEAIPFAAMEGRDILAITPNGHVVRLTEEWRLLPVAETLDELLTERVAALSDELNAATR